MGVLESIDLQERFQRLPNRVAASGTDVHGKERQVRRDGGKRAFDKVVDVDQVTDIVAGAPHCERRLPFDDPPHQRSRHMADGEIELVVGAVHVRGAYDDGLHRVRNLLGIGPAKDFGITLHPAGGEIDLLGIAVEHLGFARRAVRPFRG